MIRVADESTPRADTQRQLVHPTRHASRCYRVHCHHLCEDRVRRDGDSAARRRSPIWERQGHLQKLATRENTIIRKPATRFLLPVEKALLSCRFDADCFFSGFERVVGSLQAPVGIGEFHMSLLTDLKRPY